MPRTFPPVALRKIPPVPDATELPSVSELLDLRDGVHASLEALAKRSAQLDTNITAARYWDKASPPPPPSTVASSVPRSPVAQDKAETKRKREDSSSVSDPSAQIDAIPQKMRKIDQAAEAAASTQVHTVQQTSSTVAASPTSVVSRQPPGLTLKLKVTKPPHRIEALQQRRIPPAPGVADDFSVPSRSLVPPKTISVAPQPTPKHPFNVHDDFSAHKPPSTQVASATFASFVEQYLRSFGEDDLAFLSAKSNDNASAFEVPPLGRWYQDVWAEEDAVQSPSQSPAPENNTASGLEPPSLRRFHSSNLTEETMAKEDVYLGPLSERLVSCLSFPNDSRPPFRAIVDEQPKIESDADDHTDDISATELEDRLRRELKYLGVFSSGVSASSNTSFRRDSGDSVRNSAGAGLGGVRKGGTVDWSQRQDDEISAALRACQRLLRDQLPVNEKRKQILSQLVRDRMAFQEYQTLKDALEKEVEAGWGKLQRAYKRKSKQKGGIAKPSQNRPSNTATATATPGTPMSASTQQAAPVPNTDPNKVPFPDSLYEALDKRQRFTEGLGKMFEDTAPGKYRGLVTKSIYEDDPQAQVSEPSGTRPS